MSFSDGVVNVARSVLGMPPRRDETPRPAPTPAPQRGDRLAADTPTTFRPATDATTTGTYGGPSLAERLRAVQPAQTSASRILPPHLVGRRGEVPPAESTPVADQGVRTTAPANASRAPASTAEAVVIDASTGTLLGTTATLTVDNEAGVAAYNVQQGLDYYAQSFGRDGIDGAGSGVDVLVNDRSRDERGEERFAGNGGYYATTRSDGSVGEAIHFGSGKRYEGQRGTVAQYSMLHAEDLAIHELTHGIIRKETGYLGGEADEAGATNEGVADVMAAAATRDWSMGETMYADDSRYRRMRNIADPDDPTAIHGLWTSMDQVRQVRDDVGEAEEHWASGIISTAAYRVQQRLGGEAGWQAIEQTFYDSIEQHRLGDMSYSAVAGALRTSASSVYGSGSVQAQVFDEELRRAGL